MSVKIMLDAGHHGKTNQSPVVPEYYESVVMWKLCEYLSEELSAYGFEVLKTRADAEKDLAVVKRGELAKGCDLFISLHSNAVGGIGNELTDRVDVYHSYDNLNNSEELAKILAKAVAECMAVTKWNAKTRKGSNGKSEYYGVLRGARSVGCPLYYIIEHSFHTNKKAAYWLLQDENLRRLARIEAGVIAGYFGNERGFLLGDVDINGRLDSYDVLLIKRAFFGTVTLTDEQKKRADIDGNGTIDAYDYLLAKRKQN